MSAKLNLDTDYINAITSFIDAGYIGVVNYIKVKKGEGETEKTLILEVSGFSLDLLSIVNIVKKSTSTFLVDIGTFSCDSLNFMIDIIKEESRTKIISDGLKIGKDILNLGVDLFTILPQGRIIKLFSVFARNKDLLDRLSCYKEILKSLPHDKNTIEEIADYRKLLDGIENGKNISAAIFVFAEGLGILADGVNNKDAIVDAVDINDIDDVDVVDVDVDSNNGYSYDDNEKNIDMNSVEPLLCILIVEWWKQIIPEKYWEKFFNPLEEWPVIDPVVLNLSKDEISKSIYTSIAHFDYDGDGFAEMTEWIGQNQGLLVMDRNGNGIIDDGSELFGNQTVLSNGRQAVDGYQALTELDDNKDGIIDASDTSWSKLLIWIDNGDGVTQNDELKTLDELGIVSVKKGMESDSFANNQRQFGKVG